MSKVETKREFGDFQTPAALAQAACRLLASMGLSPSTIIEPTCGTGSFLRSAVHWFPVVKQLIGIDINPAYLRIAETVCRQENGPEVVITQGDFFKLDWKQITATLADHLLILGNPPWVTNSALGSITSRNLPAKSNSNNRRGVDAITGKSNFDISEWMITRMFELVSGREATVAMLCKTAVARKVLKHAWQNGMPLRSADIFLIDAQMQFGAAVEAGFLVAGFGCGARQYEARIHQTLDPLALGCDVIGWRDGELIADLLSYNQWKHLRGGSAYKWRSGIKHDCADIMELVPCGPDTYKNGCGDLVHLEPMCLYPMLKSSEITSKSPVPTRVMLVPQRKIAETTETLKQCAPKTWRYLETHADRLDSRASRVYAGRPRFSVFGVGDYSFSPWKVAISGFYKQLEFKIVPPICGKPVILDDTAYFLPCWSSDEANLVAGLLNSAEAKAFLSSYVFWDNKRPITMGVLSQLSMESLATQCGKRDELLCYLVPNADRTARTSPLFPLFDMIDH